MDEDFSKMSFSEYARWYRDHAPQYPFMDDFTANGPHWHRTTFYLPRIEPYGKILDCGCSNGGLAKYLTETIPCEYVAVDIAYFFVYNTKNNAPLSKTCTCAVESLPFRNDCFDHIIAGEILEHVLDIELVIKEIVRVLKPGGNFLITTPRPEDSVGGQHVRYLGIKELGELLPGIHIEDNQYSWLSEYRKV